MFCIRSADGKGYEVHILAPLKNFPSGDAYTDACAVNAATEEMINYAPAQYLWGHRRFKHMEDGSNPYAKQLTLYSLGTGTSTRYPYHPLRRQPHIIQCIKNTVPLRSPPRFTAFYQSSCPPM